MEIFIYVILFIFGTLFGSFASVIISRLYTNKPGILKGRSKCTKCGKILGFKDLIPIFSYIMGKGKCRYCLDKISPIYPVYEILMGLVFAISGYFFIDLSLLIQFNINEIIKLSFFLILGFLSFIYIVYDIKYLEIPDSILAILIAITSIVVIYQGTNNINIINTLPSYIEYETKIIMYQIIYLLIVLIGLYTIMLKGLSEKIDILIFISISLIAVIFYKNGISLHLHTIGSSILGILVIFGFLFSQIVISGGRWMGGGDLRIAILIGLLVGIGYIIPTLMIIYIIGSLGGIITIIISKLIKKDKNFQSQIPFGPFLGIGLYLVLIFQYQIDEFIKIYF